MTTLKRILRAVTVNCYQGFRFGVMAWERERERERLRFVIKNLWVEIIFSIEKKKNHIFINR